MTHCRTGRTAAYSCPRGCGLSVSCGPNWGSHWNPLTYHNNIVLRDFSGLLIVPLLCRERDGSFSENVVYLLLQIRIVFPKTSRFHVIGFLKTSRFHVIGFKWSFLSSLILNSNWSAHEIILADENICALFSNIFSLCKTWPNNMVWRTFLQRCLNVLWKNSNMLRVTYDTLICGKWFSLCFEYN